MNYQKIYNSIIERSQNRILQEYTEKHHILPRCMGGTDDSNNIAILTPEEHYVAHQLLIKIYPNEHKLVYALRMMCMGSNKIKRNNKEYSWTRKLWAKTSSESQKGIPRKPHTEEAKKKISEAGIGRPSGMKDKQHTEETKNKISEKLKDKSKGPSKLKGTTKSQETKDKMSAAQKGKGKGRIPWNKGIPLSEKAKKEMGDKNSKNLKGKTWEEIYGKEGAAKRRESLRLKKLQQ